MRGGFCPLALICLHRLSISAREINDQEERMEGWLARETEFAPEIPHFWGGIHCMTAFLRRD